MVFNVFIFQVFSTRSDLKMAVLFVSQPVTSPLARNSSTQESKCRAICFNCKIPNHLLDAYTHSIAVDMRTIGLHTG